MIRLIFISLLIISEATSGQSPTLHTKIKAILADQSFDFATVGLSVARLDGESVMSIDGDRKLIPASSLKLITTLTALDILGAEYTFKTRIGYGGNIDRSGTLNGDLVIIGSGDPTLGAKRFDQGISEIFAQISNAVSAKGIKCIDGNIEVRSNVFSGQPIPGSWPYGDVANYYGSGSWAINFNENEYNLFFKPKIEVGSIALVDYTQPIIPHLNIRSEVVTKGKNTGDNAYIYGDQYHYNKIVRGSIPYDAKGFKIKGSIPNPPLSFAMMLMKYLEDKGVSSDRVEIVQTPIKNAHFNELLTLESHPLSEIIRQANYESINLYCEALLRLMGKKEKSEGSIEAGLSAIEERLSSMNIDKYSYDIKDGSGLSPRNGITTNSFTKYINETIRIIGVNEVKSYLPQTGVTGTVSNLLKNKKAQTKFYLKSGSMGGVLSYTGIFQGRSGDWFSVSFISNNHSRGNSAVRRKAEEIFEVLYSSL